MQWSTRSPKWLRTSLLLPLALFFFPAIAFAASDVYKLDLGGMSMGLFGGVALFLFGMEMMGDSLKAAAGEEMKYILSKLTTNRVTGAMTGAFVTAVIQSSSVTTVLVVGFVSAGLMTLPQSIGVIMGANIGTTITAQIIAFKISKLALLFVAVGFFLLFVGKQDRTRHYGGVIMGLGLIFYGMNVMSQAMYPLRDYPPFLDFMVKMDQPVYAILVAALFTALVQSSSATTGIVIVMSTQGFISLPAGISLALGANIGTCITAMLASLGKPRVALRTASVHVIFNVLGVVIWLPFITPLANFSASIASETPRQIANANTLFNFINTIIFIGFSGVLARFVVKLFPDQDEAASKEIIRPKFLDDELLETPSLALKMARLEIGHLGEKVMSMLAQIKGAMESKDNNLLQEIRKMDDTVDILHGEIVHYLSRIGKSNLTETDNKEFYLLTHAVENIEGIGDVIETDLVSLGHTFIKEELEPSETMWQLIGGLHVTVCEAVKSAINAIAENDQKAAQHAISLKGDVSRCVDAAFQRQVDSLAVSAETRISTLRSEFEVVDRFKRIYTLSKRIARQMAPPEMVKREESV